MNIYYVYAYVREDQTPYYIGKGKGYRINVKNRTIPIPPKERRIKLSENLTEEEAFNLEMELIAKYGRIDLGTGVLRNMNDGGPGGRKPKGKIPWNKGKKEDPEVTKKRTASLKGVVRSEEYKRKMSEAKKGCIGSWNGRKHSEETKKKISDFNIGRKRGPMSAEHKAKIAQALKKR